MPLVGYICIYDHLLDGFYHFLIFMKLRNDFHMEFVLQFRARSKAPNWESVLYLRILAFSIHFCKLYAIIGFIHFQNSQRTNLKCMHKNLLNFQTGSKLYFEHFESGSKRFLLTGLLLRSREKNLVH